MGGWRDQPGRVLVVDDDPIVGNALRRAFEARDWDVDVAASSKVAIDLAQRSRPKLAIVDLFLGNTNGIDLLPELQKVDAAIHVVMLTGSPSVSTAVDSLNLGALTYLSKPVTIDEILAAIDRAIEQKRAAFPLPRRERDLIEQVLAECGNNRSEAARRLGIDRSTLRRKLAKQ